MQTLGDTVCLSSCCLVNVATGCSVRKGREMDWRADKSAGARWDFPWTCPPSFPNRLQQMVPTLHFELKVPNIALVTFCLSLDGAHMRIYVTYICKNKLDTLRISVFYVNKIFFFF